MKERDRYSWVALVLVITGEVLAFCGIRYGGYGWWLLSVIVGVLLAVLWIVGRRHKYKFSLSSVILTKLLANAIAPSTLGTIYLLFFVTHLGWLADASIGLFMPSNELADVLPAVGVSLTGMLALIISFPNGEQKKNKHPSKIFFSGISAVRFNETLDRSNLHPIVRMLQLTDGSEDYCELFILHSNYYSNPNKVVTDNYNQYWESTLKYINDDAIKLELQQKLDVTEDITEKLKLLIRLVAIAEFPDKEWVRDPKRLHITFSEQCDYQRFDSCFNVLNKIVKEKDTFANLLFFNLSPGTANVSALMTLLAIDGDRKLYYYLPIESKEGDEREERTRLIEVSKNEIPLQNLLSQALDSFEI